MGKTTLLIRTEQILAEQLRKEMDEDRERIAADIVLGCMRDVPPEIMATLPKDGASQHDHYIHGWPRRET